MTNAFSWRSAFFPSNAFARRSTFSLRTRQARATRIGVLWVVVALSGCAVRGVVGREAPLDSGRTIDDPHSGLPTLPPIRNVTAHVDGDSVLVRFQPVDGARDYRVYALPSRDRIAIDSQGFITIANATYRCSGDRETPEPMVDDGPDIQSNAARTIVDSIERPIDGYLRSEAEALLGYAYAEPGEGRSPVYVLGDPSPGGDNYRCYFARWDSTRVKRYTTSTIERDTLLSAGWRDDGIAFYVPSVAAPGTLSVEDAGDHLIVAATSAERATRGNTTKLFELLTAPAADAMGVYRVFYEIGCGEAHDELALGRTLFERARYQGAEQPVTELVYSGLNDRTVLVVEALDIGCPYRGRLAASPMMAGTFAGVGYSAAYDLAALRAMDARGEVFINGQHDPSNRPRAVARTFIEVEPAPAPAMDFFDGFEQPIAPLERIDCSAPDGNCWGSTHWRSTDYDVEIYNSQIEQFAVGAVGGELWLTHADIGAGVNAMLRISPLRMATLAADSFLHVTMATDCISTGRRRAQILISDHPAPIQRYMSESSTLLIHPTDDWPSRLSIELCDHYEWDSDLGCSGAELVQRQDANGNALGVTPAANFSDVCSGADRRARFDVYASTSEVYVLLDQRPYGCASLPAGRMPSGQVSVSFGDALAHSGIDSVMGFHERTLQINASRRFDNLGFSSGVAPPTWDHSLFPCSRITE